MNCSRGQFLAGVGGLVAASALPSMGSFAERGGFERLSLAFQHIHLGLPSPFSVLHISDTHLTAAYPHEDERKQRLRASRTRTFGGLQEEALRDSLAWARKNVDFVVHTGDLIDWQSEANLDLVRKNFTGALTGCIGNHEYSPYMYLGTGDDVEKKTVAFKARSTELLQRFFPFEIGFASRVEKGVNFVSIDDVYGTFEPWQVARFREEVKKGLPIVVCLHVPIYTPDIARAGESFWQCPRKDGKGSVSPLAREIAIQHEDETTRNFISELKAEPLLKAILAGHLHITVQEVFSPTARQYVVAGNFMFHGEVLAFS